MKASKRIGSSGVTVWVCASTQREQGASSSQQFGQSNWQATGATAKANPTKNNTSQPISLGLRPKQHRQNRRPNFNLPSWNNTGWARQAFSHREGDRLNASPGRIDLRGSTK